LEWDDLQKCSKDKEQYGEEDDRARAWLDGCVASEESVGHTGGHEKERPLLGYQENNNAGSQKKTNAPVFCLCVIGGRCGRLRGLRGG
jgi:hypothetical protein